MLGSGRRVRPSLIQAGGVAFLEEAGQNELIVTQLLEVTSVIWPVRAV